MVPRAIMCLGTKVPNTLSRGCLFCRWLCWFSSTYTERALSRPCGAFWRFLCHLYCHRCVWKDLHAWAQSRFLMWVAINAILEVIPLFRPFYHGTVGTCTQFRMWFISQVRTSVVCLNMHMHMCVFTRTVFQPYAWGLLVALIIIVQLCSAPYGYHPSFRWR